MSLLCVKQSQAVSIGMKTMRFFQFIQFWPPMPAV